MGELKNIALVCYCHFKTTYLQARFIRLRSSITSETRDELYSILEEERELAVILYESMGKDSRIAYEASNHYYYTLNDLKEKVINCEYIHDCLK